MGNNEEKRNKIKKEYKVDFKNHKKYLNKTNL